ncbi:MAG TPA: Glu/Leu/Phe/Val dehydrogenase [Clostridia bacterium]|nr:Glu/Leu/Phe/Val dehydrogenase [Clostridia bacterium]
MFKKMVDSGHEKIIYCYEPSAGLKAIIAIHSTILGPAVGGCRVRKYKDESEALFDVMRLSKSMSIKNAAANLGYGGGKSVIIADPVKEKTPEMLIAFAKAVDSLGGLYYTAPDSGITQDDMNLICRHTKYAMGKDEIEGGLGFRNSNMATAYGVYLGIKAGVKIRLGIENLSGVKVAMQGVGNVGECLVELLYNNGAEVIVSDLDQSRIDEITKRFDVKVVDPNAIYDVDCDVFTPAALGGSINKNTIPRLKCKLVVGPANNQLLDDSDADLLAQRGIYYIPDFIVNCGGVTIGTGEISGLTYEEAFKKIDVVYDNIFEIDSIAKTRGITTNQAALELAWARINAGRNKKS